VRWLPALLLAGCAAAIPHPTLIHAQRANVALPMLEQGRSLFLARCGNCHLTPAPDSRSPAEWARLVPEMSQDAELTADEAAQVLAFLQAFASGPLPDAHAQRRQPDLQ
jgi:nitrate/TMAO reductase-like tetraheme cytochrome c subunit